VIKDAGSKLVSTEELTRLHTAGQADYNLIFVPKASHSENDTSSVMRGETVQFDEAKE